MPRQKGQRSCRVKGWSGGVRGGAGTRGWQGRWGWGGGQAGGGGGGGVLRSRARAVPLGQAVRERPRTPGFVPGSHPSERKPWVLCPPLGAVRRPDPARRADAPPGFPRSPRGNRSGGGGGAWSRPGGAAHRWARGAGGSRWVRGRPGA